MSAENKSYIPLVLLILAFLGIGSVIGSLTMKEVDIWYSTLNRSPLTPPNYIFPVAWTILYAMIATSGWLIWRASFFPQLRLIKSLYVIQLLLNWSWTPLFFRYHLTGLSLLSLFIMNSVVFLIIYLSYERIKWVPLFMTPYLVWILFAAYLNFYVFQYN